MIFGFWSSYWISYAGLEMKFHNETAAKDREFGDPETAEGDATMVDFANIMKAICYTETEMGYGDGDMYCGPHYGLMQCGPNYNANLSALSGYCSKEIDLNFFYFDTVKGGPVLNKNSYNTNPFNEIGMGVTNYMLKLIKRGKFSYQAGGDRTPKVWELIDGSGYYNGKDRDDPYPTDDPLPITYEKKIRNLFLYGKYPH
ncbi:MAG: hypothetical protein KAH01_01435 [Caldisericia bacterium]|nr:hypothetical protein [Caldisericia bacterium]